MNVEVSLACLWLLFVVCCPWFQTTEVSRMRRCGERLRGTQSSPPTESACHSRHLPVTSSQRPNNPINSASGLPFKIKSVCRQFPTLPNPILFLFRKVSLRQVRGSGRCTHSHQSSLAPSWARGHITSTYLRRVSVLKDSVGHVRVSSSPPLMRLSDAHVIPTST